MPLLDPQALIEAAGVSAAYAVVVIIFLENAFVITSFLPGDSLLFVLGLALSTSLGDLPPLVVATAVAVAAFLGSWVSFELGNRFGVTLHSAIVRSARGAKWVKTSHDFFERHGARAIILARFVPIVRALVPFIVALGEFPRARFLKLNAIGATIWVYGLMSLGYFLGEIPWVHENLDPAIIVVIVVTSLPFPIEILVRRLKYLHERRADR